ncbi:MAG: hypothetical protein LBS07_03150 [Prevotellaceae bacterium]|jgi:uncharacterized protein (TIGR00661 family)|nr:hypothetical protein [Prevotellaceae bacterium]
MKILVCPLNWGLGHAARCVPLIRRMISGGHEVRIASDGYPLEFLRQEFPQLQFVELPSYNIRYSSGKSQTVAMLANMPRIVSAVIREHRRLKRYLRSNSVDMVISDNRFGLWSKDVPSVYITHQLMIKMPRGFQWLETAVWRMHQLFINKYTSCWIPDTNDKQNFSGDLAHKYPLPANAEFIGVLSRFEGFENTVPNTGYETLCIVSGVESQRSVFEKELIERFRHSGGKTLIVRGQPQEEKKSEQIASVTLVPHLPTGDMAAHLLGAKKIVSRSGYSTIMDLATLNCLNKAEFIPTPGQTEQEYLYDWIEALY